jgi:hypothetical protein
MGVAAVLGISIAAVVAPIEAAANVNRPSAPSLPAAANTSVAAPAGFPMKMKLERTVSVSSMLGAPAPQGAAQSAQIIHKPEFDALRSKVPAAPLLPLGGGSAPPSAVVNGGGNAQGFDGISIAAQAGAGTGKYKGSNGGLEPPDQALCVGNGFTIEGVNQAFQIFTTAAVALTPPIPIVQFFDMPPKSNLQSDFVSDPRCMYDPATRRFFAITLEIDEASGTSQVPFTRSHNFVAVSKTSDPTGAWYIYSFDVTDDGLMGTPLHATCPCLGDQPLMGADANGFYLSTNEFSYSEVLPVPPPPVLNGPINTIFTLPDFRNGQAQLYGYSKAQMVAGAASVNGETFDSTVVPLPTSPAPPTGAVWASLQPAHSPPGDSSPSLAGVNGAEYFLSSMDFNGAGANQLAVWALTNTLSLNTIPNLTLKEATMSTISGGYQAATPDASPFAADQKTGPTPLGAGCLPSPCPFEHLNANDDRMNEVMLTNGVLYSGLNTVLPQINGSGDYRVGIQYYEVRPGFDISGNLTTSMETDGYVNVPGESVLFPSIGATPAGQVVMGFTLSGLDYFPSAAWAELDGIGSNGPTVHISGPGVNPEDGFTGYCSQGIVNAGPCTNSVARWGDYTATEVDEQGCVWTATEYIPNDPSLTGAGNWGSFVTRVPAGQCVEPALTPTPFVSNDPVATTCPGPQVLDPFDPPLGDAPNDPGSFPGGDGNQIDSLEISSVSFDTDLKPNPTKLIITMTIPNLTAPPPPPANMAAGGFWAVYWKWGTTTYDAVATGTGNAASVMFTAGTSSGNVSGDSLVNTAITGSFTPGTPGTIVFQVPLSTVGSPPNGATLTKIYADTHGAPAPTTIWTAAVDSAPDAGFGADYIVGQICGPVVPETSSVAVMGGVGATLAGLAIVVGRRRRRRREVLPGSQG